jgi:hypothetical protein
MSDHTSPIATYKLGGKCYSGIIADNHLYLGLEKQIFTEAGLYLKWKNLHVFEVTTSLSQPLVSV